MSMRVLRIYVCAALMTLFVFAQTPDKDWGPCSTPSGKGYCMDTTLCTGSAIHLPGYCPGPRGIQCCVPHGVDIPKVTGITVGVLSGISR